MSDFCLVKQFPTDYKIMHIHGYNLKVWEKKWHKSNIHFICNSRCIVAYTNSRMPFYTKHKITLRKERKAYCKSLRRFLHSKKKTKNACYQTTLHAVQQ